MALDRIKRELNEKAIRDAQALKEKREVDFGKKQELDEYKKLQLPALQCLLQLEDFFWECVGDFSRLENLKIHYSNRHQKSWWNLKQKKTLLTIEDARLYVSFKGFENDGYDHKTINLVVFLQQGLQFTADYGCSGRSIHDGHYIEGKSYLRVIRNLSIESFEITKACKWLESNFEEYYEKLNGIYRIRND